MELLDKILACATQLDSHHPKDWSEGECKVKARFSNHDGPVRPDYGKIKEVTLHVKKRNIPNKKPGWSNWQVYVKDFNWAEYANYTDVSEMEGEPGIEFMAEEWRMWVLEVL